MRSTAAARATAAALSEAVRPLSGAVCQATGLEERSLAVAVAGEVTTIARLKLKVSWTYHLNIIFLPQPHNLIFLTTSSSSSPYLVALIFFPILLPLIF